MVGKVRYVLHHHVSQLMCLALGRDLASAYATGVAVIFSILWAIYGLPKESNPYVSAVTGLVSGVLFIFIAGYQIYKCRNIYANRMRIAPH